MDIAKYVAIWMRAADGTDAVNNAFVKFYKDVGKTDLLDTIPLKSGELYEETYPGDVRAITLTGTAPDKIQVKLKG